ncbi:MAG: transglutaminase-like cysteine peptidase [Pseudomonadota bacterium]
MRRAIFFALIFIAISQSIGAQAEQNYLFDGQLPSGTAAEHPLWTVVLQRHADQQAQLSACLDQLAACPRYLRGWQRIVKRAHGLNDHAKLVLINRFFNKRRYVDDVIDPVTQLGTWLTLSDFLEHGGDCEDFAIAKYFTLRELGFGPERLRILSAWDKKARDYHAILAVNIDGRAHFLENDNTVLHGRQLRPYAFLYAVNEDHWWYHSDGHRDQANL